MANKDQVAGKLTEIKGNVREAVGDATGDEKQVAKGQTEQASGKAQGAVGKVKEVAQDLGDKASRTVEGVVEGVKDASR